MTCLYEDWRYYLDLRFSHEGVFNVPFYFIFVFLFTFDLNFDIKNTYLVWILAI
jgi:hypothetical protein